MTKLKLQKFTPIDWFEFFLYTGFLFFLASRKNEALVEGTIEHFFGSESFFGRSELPVWALLIGENALAIVVAILFVISMVRMRYKYFCGYIFLYGAFVLIFNIRMFEIDDLFRSVVGVAVGIGFCTFAMLPMTVERLEKMRFVVLLAFYTFAAASIVVSLILLFGGWGYQGERFSGMAFHPNQCGQIFSLCAIFLSCVSTIYLRHKNIRNASIVLTAFAVLVVGASGSRGALLTLIFGWILISLFLVAGSKKFAAFAFLAGALFISYLVFSEVENGPMSRFLDAGDNRTDAFGIMIDAFLSSPLIGVGMEIGASENAILKALAGTGLLGGLFFIGFIFYLCFVCCSSLIRLRTHTNDTRNGVFYIVVLSVFFSSIFDGYMAEKLSFSGAVVVLFLGACFQRPQRFSVRHD